MAESKSELPYDIQSYIDIDIPRDNPLENDRILLVERSRLDGSYWVTDHPSQEDAARYHDDQEYAEDWTITVLFDRETEKRYYPVSHTTFEELR